MARCGEGDQHQGLAVTPAPGTVGSRWILLLHQLPPKPDYARVKVWRRLQRIGAVAIKNSVYVLPRSDQAIEHFQWILREIAAIGGEGSLCEAVFVEGLSDAQIEALFRTARDADYGAITQEIEDLVSKTPSGRALDEPARSEVETVVTRLRRRMAEIGAIDFFGAPARRIAEAGLDRLEARIRPSRRKSGKNGGRSAGKPRRNQTWVTRRGVYVDRVASAWLIRRFIDPKARFRFVDEREYRPGAGEVRFDMFDGEYTHEGDRCTFETLMERFGLADPALRALAEIVHDIDLKDGKFGRPETPGFERLADSLVRVNPKDEDRLKAGSALLEEFYQAFR